MLRADNLSKYYGAKLIFDRVSFVINEGEKSGLVGKNGSGKSTLLKLLSGVERPDDGLVLRSPGTTVGYLPQTLEVHGRETVRATIDSALGKIPILRSRLGNLEEQMSRSDLGAGEMDGILAQYGDTRTRFEAIGGYEVEHEIDAVLHSLGLGGMDLDRPMGSLSGGEQIKLALARLLLSNPSLLLLDEPTNNLDLPALLWLEKYLKRYQGGVLVVSHDRRFLDRVVGQIIELDERERTTKIYPGNFSAYSRQKRVERAKWEAAYRDQQEWICRVERDIRNTQEQAKKTESETTNDFQRQLAKKVARKAKTRERKLERLLESEERLEKPPQEWSLKLDLDSSLSRQTMVARVRGVSWSYGDRTVLKQLDLDVRGRDRTVIVGGNGSGKSTLLKMVVQEMEPAEGTVQIGKGVRVGYFSQDHSGLDPDRTVHEEFCHDLAMYESEARRLLSYFLFFGDEVSKTVGSLSLGERAKLVLAKIVASGANFLVLDEPANHMDYKSLEVVESALRAFNGAILLVSHDRHFVDAAGVDRVYSLDDGRLRLHPGGYPEYEAIVVARGSEPLRQ